MNDSGVKPSKQLPPYEEGKSLPGALNIRPTFLDNTLV